MPGQSLVKIVAATNDTLEGVLEIHREQKAFLGPMPKGAFEERLRAGQLLIAVLDAVVIGYVLFSTNQNQEVRIAHLAVGKEHQGKGVASRLLTQLKKQHSQFVRIRLHCRSDFDAAKVWPRLGFIAIGRKPAKAVGKQLTVFQYAFQELPLFSESETGNGVPIVVCDANVCIDIEMPTRPRHETSAGLLADWLVGEIELRVAPEILNDLERQDDDLRTAMVSAIRSNWLQLRPSQTNKQDRLRVIRAIMGTPRDASAASDQSHLATAAAAGATAFVTYDNEIHTFRDSVFSETGLQILRPSQVIVEIDSLIREHHYQYSELSKSGVRRSRVSDLTALPIDQFFKSTDGESGNKFKAQLDSVLALPGEWDFHQIRRDSGQCLAIITCKNSSDGVRTIKKIRVAHPIRESVLGRTLADYLSHQPLGAWDSRQKQIVRVADKFLAPGFAMAFMARGFLIHENEPWRISLPGFWDYDSLCGELSLLANQGTAPFAIVDQLLNLAERVNKSGYQPDAQKLENLIHPGKLTFGELPTYVIPIQPAWAKELFDFRIWDYPLFPPETKLLINPDSVYYKRPKNSPTTDFGRLLWYVSGDSKKGGGRIRACSSLTRRVTGSVKNLYREFRRMGVFDWAQLMGHFESPESEALAIEFSNTELLPEPVDFQTTNKILQSNGMKPQQFMSALKIPQDAFATIYSSAYKETK